MLLRPIALLLASSVAAGTVTVGSVATAADPSPASIDSIFARFDVAAARIFGPLDMTSTQFHVDNTRIVERHAEGYQPMGPGAFSIVRTSFALVGNGGLLTTVEDLLHWDGNVYQNKLGREGPSLTLKVAGQTLPLLATSDSSFTTSGAPDPLVFSGRADAPMPKVAALGMTKPTPRLRPAPVLTAERAAAYAGHYTSDELDTWATIKVEGGTLMARTRWGPWETLEAIAPAAFVATGTSVRFVRGRGGVVTGFTLSQARTRNLIVERAR